MQIYEQADLQEAHSAFFTAGRTAPPKALPPGIVEETFDRVLQCLGEALGEENVVTGAGLANFVDPFAIHLKYVPSAAVW